MMGVYIWCLIRDDNKLLKRKPSSTVHSLCFIKFSETITLQHNVICVCNVMQYEVVLFFFFFCNLLLIETRSAIFKLWQEIYSM